MATLCEVQSRQFDARFGLKALLGYTTVCAVLSALAATYGFAAGVMLMLLSLALAARQGGLALVALAAASLAADWPHATQRVESWQAQIAVILTAAALCGWYLVLRIRHDAMRPVMHMGAGWPDEVTRGRSELDP